MACRCEPIAPPAVRRWATCWDGGSPSAYAIPAAILAVKGLEPSQSPSPEMSHEEALSKPRGFHISLPGAPCARYTLDSC